MPVDEIFGCTAIFFETYFYTPLSFKIASDKAMLTSDPAITCVTVWRRSTTRDQLTSASNKNAGNITAP